MPERFIKRLGYLDECISKRATGNPAQMANKLGVSKRTFFFLIGILKALGGPIKYSRKEQTYYYYKVSKFIVGYESSD